MTQCKLAETKRVRFTWTLCERFRLLVKPSERQKSLLRIVSFAQLSIASSSTAAQPINVRGGEWGSNLSGKCGYLKYLDLTRFLPS